MVTNKSLVQETALRYSDRKKYGPPTIICNVEHRFVVAEQMRDAGIDDAEIILEPVGRNSAPAAAVAALAVQSRDPNGMVLLLAADHVMRRLEAFHQAISVAAKAAKTGLLVTFGISPSRPETGYGYIQRGASIGKIQGAYDVQRFVEKPNFDHAKQYFDSGDFYWNSGNFLFSAKDFISELDRLEPEIGNAAKTAFDKGKRDLDFLRLDEASFAEAPSISIDYAVMEKTASAAVVPTDPGWSDVGSWTELWEISEKDHNDNVLTGAVIAHDVRGSLVKAEKRLVVAVGVDNIAVIETADAVLVMNKNRAQELRNAVDEIKALGRDEATSHSLVHRPWGTYENVDTGDGFLVKRIMVKPGGRLSLQRHAERAEHWVVIEGTARVTRGEDVNNLEELDLETGHSIDIPVRHIHRLENPWDTPCVIVEIQTGSYLAEDDIERFDDVYGRVE